MKQSDLDLECLVSHQHFSKHQTTEKTNTVNFRTKISVNYGAKNMQDFYGKFQGKPNYAFKITSENIETSHIFIKF